MIPKKSMMKTPLQASDIATIAATIFIRQCRH
jgi:hypothetical protein